MLPVSFEGPVTVEVRNLPGRKTVAFCGTRGVPANYGGFETTVDEISRRFAENGYDPVVYCRKSSYPGIEPEYHEGRRLVYVKGSSRRTLDTFVSAFETGWHVFRHRREYDYIFWFNNANLPGILLTLLTGLPTSVNTDGMEWRRAKWTWPFKLYYLLGSLLISLLCSSVITDSKRMQAFYRKTFSKDTDFIPYGIPQTSMVLPHKHKISALLERYGVEPGRYFLQITRIEPDNLPLEAARAFKAADLATDGFRFLVVGCKGKTPYEQQLKAMSGKDGIFVVDAIYDTEVVTALRTNCFCYIHGNSVGGTNPALLEAMASCPRVLSIDVPFNREVLGDEGHFFKLDDIVASFRGVLSSPDNSAALRKRVHSQYQWGAVVKSYMNLVEGQPANYSPTPVKWDDTKSA